MGNTNTTTAKFCGVWLAGAAAGALLCKAQRSRAPARTDGLPPPSQSCTFINCSSIAESADFYQKVLGLELVYEQKGFVAFFRLTTSTFLCVCLRQNREEDFRGDTKGAIVSLVFQTNAEVDAWHEALAAKAEAAPGRAWSIDKRPGAGISSDGKVVPIYNMFLKDPAGYLVEFEVFHDKGWPSA
jgi:catechol 2,3-dioxygenase-like lactoylglutathione lyase family enzyme